jgi:hypothetical protein
MVRGPYGKLGAGYTGDFSLTMPFTAESGSRPLAVSPCTTSTYSGTVMAVEFFVALAYMQVVPDDSLPHYGTVGGDAPDQKLKVSFDANWSRC